MADAKLLDATDRTPLKVLDGMLATHKPYTHDECIPCGAVTKIGFFFDGFGRSRDQEVDLAIEGDTIESRFLGLADAVSSLIAENKLLDVIPLVNPARAMQLNPSH